jgi:hypothetical protein
MRDGGPVNRIAPNSNALALPESEDAGPRPISGDFGEFPRYTIPGSAIVTELEAAKYFDFN